MITRGIGTVAKGMQALIDFEDVTAHNLANVTTTGFKRTNITFQDVMQSQVQAKNAQGNYKNVGSLSMGARTDRTYIDFSQGGLQETGYKLDVAIQGDGFFKVRHQDVPDNAPYDDSNYYYQRVGNFALTTDNYLVNKDGDYIMDVNDRRITIELFCRKFKLWILRIKRKFQELGKENIFLYMVKTPKDLLKMTVHTACSKVCLRCLMLIQSLKCLIRLTFQEVMNL